ncbi:MAG: VPLPA-CTERM sorting domain-containing protein [Pseudomonadota bacterium]
MRTSLAAVAATLLSLSAQPSLALTFEVFEINGPTAADIEGTVDAFRDALGPNNGNNPVNADPNGRRQINWDAAPDFIADPNPFPGDFFNFNAAPRARGIEFRETGTTTGFELSATEASGTEPVFGVPTDFAAFSPERLFRPVGGQTFDVLFFDPATQKDPALTRGLGVVFSDVEKVGSTSMSFFDINDELLFERDVIPGADIGFSFLGVIFDSPLVAKVSIQSGTRGDAVVMDDFIFGEPVPAPVPLPASVALLAMGIGALGVARRKRTVQV